MRGHYTILFTFIPICNFSYQFYECKSIIETWHGSAFTYKSAIFIYDPVLMYTYSHIFSENCILNILYASFFWSGSFRYSELEVFLAQAKVKYKTCTIPGQGCLLQSSFMSVNIMDEFRPGGRQTNSLYQKKKKLHTRTVSWSHTTHPENSLPSPATITLCSAFI